MQYIFYFSKQIHSFSGKILYMNLISMIIISLFEGIGILLLIPLINLSGVVNVGTNTIPILSWILNFFYKIPETLQLPIILSLYILLVVGQSFFHRKQIIINAKIQQGFIRYLREETYKALLQSNWSLFLNKRKSDIINLMTSELARVNAGTILFLQFITSLVFTIIQLGIAFWLSIEMTTFVLLFGIGMIFFLRKFVKKSNNLGKETVELSQAFIAGITDQFNGIKDIKSNMLEVSHIKWFRDINKKMENNIVNIASLNTLSQLTYKIVSAILIAFFMYFSIKMFKQEPAEMILIIMIFSRLWPRFSGIQASLEQLGAVIPAFKALSDVQSKCLEAKEFDEKHLHDVIPITIRNEITCVNVSFRYNSNEPFYALKNINLSVPANKMTAIVGRSGAGKSTLIDLIMGLNEPQYGNVLIDGKTLTKENILSLRKSLSYVPQDPFLFNATIRENLLIIDQNATEEQIWEALEFAAAEDFVKKLPNGLDSLIGDRGIKLSGGERQRLVLARAILRKPSILILDEATSALDTHNESHIQGAIERLKGKMTILIIAHRLSTIRYADQVIVLEQGEIIQKGQFNKLAKEKNGMFNHLLKKQIEVSV